MISWAQRLILPLVLGLPVLVGGCRSERLLEPDPAGSRPANSAAPAKAGAAAPAGPRVRFVKAPEGDVAGLVKNERGAAAKDQRSLLVYVGATWCEPCQRFHEAAGRGELDSDLPALTLLEFDADQDIARLRAAGYSSTYIPLFVVPGEDGRSSGKFIEGGIKGPGGAKEIVPRLNKLIASR